MKTWITFLTGSLLCLAGRGADLQICPMATTAQPGVTEVQNPRGLPLMVGAPLLTVSVPTELTLEYRRVLGSLYNAHNQPSFLIADRGYFTIPLTKEQLEQLAKALPEDRTTSLVIVMDQWVLGATPFTRDWRKWGCGAGGHLYGSHSEEWKRLQTANVKVIDKTRRSLAGYAPALATPADLGKLEDLICQGKAGNPVQTTIQPAQRAFFLHEPVQAVIALRNIGIEQSMFQVKVRDMGNPAENLKAVSGSILRADANHAPPARPVEDRKVPWLAEGESSSTAVNLTRAVGCEFATAGTGPLSLQFRLYAGPTVFPWAHNPNAWLDLPPPDVTIAALEAAKFTEIKSAAVTGSYDTVRLGTHPLDGKTVTVAAYGKAGKVGRILRLDPNPDTKSWELAWDGTAQQLHILQHGTRARYWMTAADQLGWEVRMDVPDYSKLETTDGKVRRTE